MKNNKVKYILGWIVLIGLLSSQISNYTNGEFDSALGYTLGTLEFCIISFLVMIVPFIIWLLNDKNIDYRKGVIITLIDVLAWWFISMITTVVWGFSIIGALGAILYGFVILSFFANSKSVGDGSNLKQKSRIPTWGVQAVEKDENKIYVEDVKVIHRCPQCNSTDVKIKNGVLTCYSCGSLFLAKKENVSKNNQTIDVNKSSSKVQFNKEKNIFKFCPYCGEELIKESMFCHKCGEKLY